MNSMTLIASSIAVAASLAVSMPEQADGSTVPAVTASTISSTSMFSANESANIEIAQVRIGTLGTCVITNHTTNRTTRRTNVSHTECKVAVSQCDGFNRCTGSFTPGRRRN